jgi:hypothetical protein
VRVGAGVNPALWSWRGQFRPSVSRQLYALTRDCCAMLQEMLDHLARLKAEAAEHIDK